MRFLKTAIKGSLGLLGATVLTLVPGLGGPSLAQSRAGTPYCFVVKEKLSVFSRPAADAATGDTFKPGDIAYATTNPPRTVLAGNRSFVEVAIYGGNRGWLPRTSTVDGVPLIVDLSTDQCTRP